MTIRTILVALALDDGAARIAARALQLAHEHRAKLVAVHVIEELPHSLQSVPPNEDKTRDRLLNAASEGLYTLVARAEPAAELYVAAGKPHEIINGLARESGADLIVIGPGVAQGLRERVFGSTADRVIRHGPAPVIIVRGEVLGPYRHATIGTDFSAHAQAAAVMTQRVAPVARREFLHTVEIPLGFEQAMLKVGTAQADITQYRRARAAAARRELAETHGEGGTLPPGCVMRVVQGDAATALVNASRRRRTDLVVIGTQGAGAVAQHLLGSVARKVLSHARSDVLVVPLRKG